MRALFRWIFRLLLLALGALLAWQLWLFGHVVYWKYENPAETSFMRMRLEQLQQKDEKARLKQQWVPYDRISIHLKRAIIVAEDDKFVDHEGFDWEAIQKALEQNRKQGRVVRGGSTISQQLAKNLFLWRGSGWTRWARKGLEVWYTLLIETLWPKQRILEVYANVIEYGDGVYGAQAAARRYFGKDASKLSAAEAARLAAVLPNPRKYSVAKPGPYVQRRTRAIQRQMRALGGPAYLTFD